MSVEDSSKVILKSKADVEKLLAKEGATIIHREAGKSEIWKIFRNIEYDHSIVQGYVVYVTLKLIVNWNSSIHSSVTENSWRNIAKRVKHWHHCPPVV